MAISVDAFKALVKKHENKAAAASFVSAANLIHLDASHFVDVEALVADLNAEEAPAPPAAPPEHE